MAAGPEDDADDNRPFDIREWESAAREIGVAAERLAQTGETLRELSELPNAESAAAVSKVVDASRSSAEALVDYALWRVLLLCVALFALMLLYRLIAARLTAR